MRVAIYARVSTKTKGQDTENQLHQLRAFAEQHGTLYKVFTDEESGGKADRTEFKALLLEAYQKKFDLVVFWRLDRFSREGALATLRYLSNYGISLGPSKKRKAGPLSTKCGSRKGGHKYTPKSRKAAYPDCWKGRFSADLPRWGTEKH